VLSVAVPQMCLPRVNILVSAGILLLRWEEMIIALRQTKAVCGIL